MSADNNQRSFYKSLRVQEKLVPCIHVSLSLWCQGLLSSCFAAWIFFLDLVFRFLSLVKLVVLAPFLFSCVRADHSELSFCGAPKSRMFMPEKRTSLLSSIGGEARRSTPKDPPHHPVVPRLNILRTADVAKYQRPIQHLASRGC